jgi:phosphinothricin acetyltransferase
MDREQADLSSTPVQPSRLFARYAPRADGRPRSLLPGQLEIAPATLEDAPGKALLVARREGCSYEEALQRACRELGPSHDRLVLIGKVGDEVLAFGKARRIAPDNIAAQSGAPIGWYLSGVVVDESYRRRGIGTELTRRRLAWIGERAGEAFYFVNSLNLPSIDLHSRLGFVEIRRPFTFPGVSFSGGGIGVLFRIGLADVGRCK